MELKPGYKQTEVGVIPEDWTAVTLEAATTHIGDGLHGTPVYTRNADYYFINGNNLSHGKIIITPDTQTVDQKEFAQHRKPLSNRSILMSINGTIGNLGLFQDQSLVLGKSAAYLNVRTDVSKLYVYHVLQSSCVRQQFFDGLTGSTIGNLGLSAIRSTYIPLPLSDSEQASIAKALGDTDDLLYSLDQLLIKKRSIKQAAMQELLTGKRRLPGFEGEWEVKRLGDVFLISAGKSKSSFVVPGGDYWVVDMGSVTTRGQLAVSKQTNFCGDFLKIGDLIMPKDDIGGGNIIGRVGYIDANTKYVLSDHVYCLRAKEGDPRFLAYMINSHSINSSLRKKVIGTAQLGLGRRSVMDQEIPFPEPVEQSVIAAILSDIDAEITALEARREKFRELKKGMMQELLTGRIRLQ